MIGAQDVRRDAVDIVGAALAGREDPAAGTNATGEPGGRMWYGNRKQRLDRNPVRFVGSRWRFRRTRPFHVMTPLICGGPVRPAAARFSMVSAAATRCKRPSDSAHRLQPGPGA